MAIFDQIVNRAHRTKEDLASDVLRRIPTEAWALYFANEDTVLFERRILFVTIRVRLRDLRPWVERLLGPQSSQRPKAGPLKPEQGW